MKRRGKGMDKREYQEKLQEINRLIAAEDFEGAAQIADSIDWKRVRNVQTLVMISEVYELLERYEDSKVLLLRAYRRSPVGRTVLYRLVECCIRLRQFDQAIEYYSEYVQAAPHDNNRYILKYKIYRGRGASLDEQIDILKEYLDQEYNEKWAYELARLQIQAGHTQEGLATCDDLVLWFHSGKYVIKALELKKKYAPLTPKQQEIYDNRFEEEEEPEIRPESYLSEAASLAKAERAEAAQEEIKSELAVDISHTAQVEATKVELSRKAEAAQAEIDRKAAQSREALSARTPSRDQDERSADLAAAGISSAKAQASETAASAASVSESADRFAPASETAGAPAIETANLQAAKPEALESAASEAAASLASASESAVSLVSAPETAGAPAFETANLQAAQPEAVESPASEAADGLASASEAVDRSLFEAEESPAVESEAEDTPAAGSKAEGIPVSETAFDGVSDSANDGPVVTAESLKDAYENTEDGAEAEEDLYEGAGSSDAGSKFREPAEPAKLPEESEGLSDESAEALAEDALLSDGSDEASEGPEASSDEPAEASAESGSTSDGSDEASAESGSATDGSDEASEEPEGSSDESSEASAESGPLSGGTAEAIIGSAVLLGGAAVAAAASSSESEEGGRPEKEPAYRGIAREPVSAELLQAEMARNVREIVSGVGPKTSLEADEAVLEEAIDQSKEDQENAVAARGTERTFQVPASEASQKRQAGRLTIDDILLSMGDGGDYVRQVTSGNVMSATEEAEMAAKSQEQAGGAAYDGSAMGQTVEGPEDRTGEEPLPDADPDVPRFLRNEVRKAKRTAEIPAVEIAEADDALRAEMGLAGRDQAASGDGAEQTAPGDIQDPAVAAAAAALMSTPRVEYTQEIAQAKTRRLPVEEIRKLHEVYLSENAGAAEEAAKNASQAAEAVADKAQAEVEQASAGTSDADVRIAEGAHAISRAASYGTEQAGAPYAEREPYAGANAKAPYAERTPHKSAPSKAPYAEREPYAGAPAGILPAGGEPREGSQGSEDMGAGFAAGAAAAGLAAGTAASGVMAADEETYAGDAFARNGRIGEQVTREVPKSEPEPPVYTGRQQLRENQKELFRGFTSIGNLSEQIAAAIWQAENRRDDRTSRSGNILILGAHGCGKTTIATGIAKAIAEDKGTHSVKMARIYAADLNRKDIAATIAKIAGGVLIVEEAGDLDDAIVDQLTTAMEFRTDGMIMILEDEQRYIHDLLMRHPRFTMKFTAQIYIPEYTGEDLVNFGQIYAISKDYVLSEGAVETCRERIEMTKKRGESVSVTNVIELVDRAIKSANTFFRRLSSAKKRYDSEDRIILLEKDFR